MLQFSPWTELTEKSTSCERHRQASNKLQAECRSGYCPEYAEAQRLLYKKDLKQKPSKSLVRTLRRFSFIVSAGYQHHRIPDGLSDLRRKMFPKV